MRPMTDNEFVVVVPSAPLAEADEAFRNWLNVQGLSREDTGRRVGGTFRRYRVRRGLIEPSAR